MSKSRFVVVGGSLAGLRAVETARKTGFDGSITLIGAEDHLPYDRPPLSKAFLAAGSGGPESTEFRTREHLERELDVELVLGSPATGLDTNEREVLLPDGRVQYDAVVIATGATLRSLPGTEGMAGVCGLRTIDDAIAIRRALDDGARTVVVGAGFIGSEVASAAQARGLQVTIVEALPTPLVRATGDRMGEAIAALHERHGTRLLCGRAVQAVRGGDRVEEVLLDDGTVLHADLVVVGIGITPATDWLRGSGLDLSNGIVCDETLWTGVEGVYAAGDVACWPNPILGQTQRMENWTAAAEQGAAAARNALNPLGASAYGTVPYFWSDWYASRIQFVGSPDSDEVQVVDGDPVSDGRWVALYRRGRRLIGALTMNAPTEIMKYRGLILRHTSWEDALTFAATRQGRVATTPLQPDPA
jgi:NADPH-dependent 2,4-dienoyl-CoA reductase/sulfur reductase-like enzyme